MARGKGKNCPKLKILAFLKSAYQKFSENALSKLKIPLCEIYYIKQDTLLSTFTKVCNCSPGVGGWVKKAKIVSS